MATQLLTQSERLSMRYIPAGFSEYKRDGDSVIYAAPDHLQAIAYFGRSMKPHWHYRFRNEANFSFQVSQFFKSVRAHKERIETRKREKKDFRTSLKPGDILETSWGYDQTNVDFFQVLEVTGKQTVIIREIGSETTEKGFMQGSIIPKKDHFLPDAKPLKKRAQSLGAGLSAREYVHIDYCRTAYPWNGQPLFCSWYA